MVKCPKCEKYRAEKYWEEGFGFKKYYRCLACGHGWHIGPKGTPARPKPYTETVR